MSRFFEVNPETHLLDEAKKSRQWRLEDLATLEIKQADFVPIAKDFKAIIDPRSIGDDPTSQYSSEPLFNVIYQNIKSFGTFYDEKNEEERIETLLLHTKQLSKLIQQELSITRATLRSLAETGKAEQLPAYYSERHRMIPSQKLEFYMSLKAAIDTNLTEPMKTAICVVLSDNNMTAPEYKIAPRDEDTTYDSVNRGYTPPTLPGM
ncbi:MAG: hypothetical protein P1U40_01950 [Coxiellaceae bacterium]|nr:hypothetical protein [Coxiellaceae bacterium]